MSTSRNTPHATRPRAPIAAGATILLGTLLLGCTPVPEGGKGSNTGGGDPLLGGGGSSGGGGGGSTGTGIVGGGGGGSSGGGQGVANVRFCNGLLNDSGTAPVELSVGSVKMSAAPGKCASACATVPTGLVRAVLRRDGKELHGEELAFNADAHYGFLALLDAKTRAVSLVGGLLPNRVTCQAYSPFTGGTTSSGPKTFGKFCHELESGTKGIELELFIGDLSLKAWTGECSTNNMQLCPLIPGGDQNLRLVSGGRVLASKSVTLDPTREYLFGAEVDDSGAMPSIFVEELKEKSCVASGIAPDAPAGTPSNMKFCNALPSGTAEITTMDGVKFSAAAGQCAPAKGMSCSKVASGEVVLKVSVDGKDVGEADLEIIPGTDFVLRLFEQGPAKVKSFESRIVPRSTTCSAYEWK
ncbi:MAG TPA: hypothetical protein VGG33_10640 [Polyangia bacterium]